MILLFVLLVLSSNAVFVQITNIHVGYKVVFEGRAYPQGAQLQVSQLNLLENTMRPQDNVDKIVNIEDTKGVLKLSELEAIEEMYVFNPMIMLRWPEKTTITVKIELFHLPDEEQEEMFNFIKSKVRSSEEDL